MGDAVELRDEARAKVQAAPERPEPAVASEEPLLQVIPPVPCAGCFLALGSGLGLVGTASSRR